MIFCLFFIWLEVENYLQSCYMSFLSIKRKKVLVILLFF